jgi:hypothetical protein
MHRVEAVGVTASIQVGDHLIKVKHLEPSVKTGGEGMRALTADL